MTKDNTHKDKDKQIERDIRSSQKYSFADAMARSSGGSLKGRSTAPQLTQATAKITAFINTNVRDTTGALMAVLSDRVKNSDVIVSRHLDSPLEALKEIIEKILKHESTLVEFVRQVDMRSGMILGERPQFQSPGQAAADGDEYTHDSVHRALTELSNKI